jgi:hypothetical protein
MSPPHSLRRALALGAVALFCLSVPELAHGSDRESQNREDFTEEVMSCEEAMSKLARCCGEFDPTRFRCVDDDRTFEGCGGGLYRERTLPLLDLKESQCIRELPCDALAQTKVCDRVKAASERTTKTTLESAPDSSDRTGTSEGALTRPAVCP